MDNRFSPAPSTSTPTRLPCVGHCRATRARGPEEHVGHCWLASTLPRLHRGAGRSGGTRAAEPLLLNRAKHVMDAAGEQLVLVAEVRCKRLTCQRWRAPEFP